MSPGVSSLQRGAAAEQRAAEYLRAQGLCVLARNLRCKAGELDLVGLDGRVLAVVEVRQRSAARFGGALGSVSRAKQRKIIRAARYFLLQRVEWRSRAMRFDVLAFDGPADGSCRTLWLKDAFRAT